MGIGTAYGYKTGADRAGRKKKAPGTEVPRMHARDNANRPFHLRAEMEDEAPCWRRWRDLAVRCEGHLNAARNLKDVTHRVNDQPEDDCDDES
jgi:hypothetical protein